MNGRRISGGSSITLAKQSSESSERSLAVLGENFAIGANIGDCGRHMLSYVSYAPNFLK